MRTRHCVMFTLHCYVRDTTPANSDKADPGRRVRSSILSGARLGVRGTPSFLINGIPFVGAQPIELWADIFKVIKEEAGREVGDVGS